MLIYSDGLIDVQAICGSPWTNDETQIQLLGGGDFHEYDLFLYPA